ncbi:unnamed protein product [Malus baccata var. baccata]
MELYNKRITQSYSCKSKEWDESEDKMGSKMAELIKTNEEIKKLETTNKSIISKKEEQHKATRMINGINQALDQTRQETKRFKCDADEELQARSRLKQAVQIEKETLVASEEKALKYINCSQMEKTTIRLIQEVYHALAKRAQDENFLSDWRVLVASEQKLATEASRNKALEKLNRLLSEKISKEGEIQEESISGDGHNGDPRNRTGGQNTRDYMLLQARNKAISKTNQRNPRSRSNNKKLSAKKKPYVVQKVRQYFVRKIKGLFERFHTNSERSNQVLNSNKVICASLTEGESTWNKI